MNLLNKLLTAARHWASERLSPDGSTTPVLGLSDRPPVGGLVLAGVAVIVVGVLGFFMWAGTAAISSAAIAQGTVRVDTNRKTVQHLDGGTISELLVSEGDRVSAGQVLLRLDDAETRAQAALLEGRLINLLAEESRLLSEQAGRNEIQWLAALKSFAGRPSYDEALAGQQNIFASRGQSSAGEVALRRQRIAQQQGQIKSFTNQLRTTETELASLKADIKQADELLAQGYERKSRVQQLRRDEASQRLRIDDLKGRIDSAKKEIAATEIAITNVGSSRTESVDGELRTVQRDRTEAEDKFSLYQLRLKRLNVIAPQAGKVLELRYFSAGGVVAPGAPILDIVPEGDKLIVDARISPLDIDVVRPGLVAFVRLTALKQRTAPSLRGRVERISADALTDEQSGFQYFQARIEIEAAELNRLGDDELYPGMPAEVMINTGERTFLEYLFSPLGDSFGRAFREQ